MCAATLRVVLSVGSGNSQVYNITVNGVLTTITVNYATGITTLTSGLITQTSARIPNGQLYVEGNITSLTGPARSGALPTTLPATSVPSQVTPAIARNTTLNITSSKTITLTGDLTYQDDPRSVAGAKNVLGLISGDGEITVGAAAPNDLYLHAALLTGKNDKGFSVVNYNSRALSGSIHLLGSMAESKDPPRGIATIGSNGTITMVKGYGDDFRFDQRFLNGAVAPPFFPATTTFTAQAAWPTQSNWQEN